MTKNTNAIIQRIDNLDKSYPLVFFAKETTADWIGEVTKSA